MSASPEFYKPAAPAAFSSPCKLPPAPADDEDYYCSNCRTPTGSGISYLKEPTTCPPAPRKPPAPPLCKKRLLFQKDQVAVISLRLEELERVFRPAAPPKQ
ncbi:hypothetical protein BAE44_0025378 [Dichanthelium oligosanthes]|uniref:Uncharacterized protein n=1 Tax=Dichanthelium oligosanthes TaxID=888268 RepID=A0A1E5UL45_9POAL|nr:hypothetical protein BAE44_0025378 [Dichanthelium oligosanthes]